MYCVQATIGEPTLANCNAGVPGKAFAGRYSDWGFRLQCILVVILVLAYCTLEVDLSGLLTLSSAFQVFGGMGLIGPSGDQVAPLTLMLYVCSFATRTIVVFKTQGYTPVDDTGDGLHLSLDVMVVLILSYVFVKQSRIRPVNPMDCTICAAVIVVSVVLAVPFNICLTGKGVYDIAWASSMFMESVAMLPQVYHMSVTEDVEENSQFVAMSFLARLSALVFQILVYDFFKAVIAKGKGIGAFRYATRFGPEVLVVIQCIQLLLICEVTYLYMRARWRDAKRLLNLEECCSSSSMV